MHVPMNHCREELPFAQELDLLSEAWAGYGRTLRAGAHGRGELVRCMKAMVRLRRVISGRTGPACSSVLSDIENNLATLRDGVIAPNPHLLNMVAHSIALLRSLLLNETPESTPHRDYHPPRRPGARPEASRPAPRILVADPDTINRRLLASLMERHGECEQAEDGYQALRRIRAAIDALQPFRLICLDPLLPNLDSLEVLRQMRRMEKKANIGDGGRALAIAIPSPDETSNIHSAQLTLECNGRLFKPICERRLLEELTRLGMIA